MNTKDEKAKLPVSGDSFRDIIQGGKTYVDKTEAIYILARWDPNRIYNLWNKFTLFYI
jgi:hypothetical protein